MSDLQELLCQLVSIPSVNPGWYRPAELSWTDYHLATGEARLTDFLESLLAEWGQSCGRQVVHPGRENLIVRLQAPHWPPVEPAVSRPVVVLSAHQDTVAPAPGMYDPWRPRVEEGRVYGLGACDVKGGMAAILQVAKRILAQPEAPPADVVLAFTVNEESGFTGARALAELFRQPDGRLLPRRPQAVVVAEPTELQVVVAHKGVVRWRIHTRGRAAHSATPEAGVSAIYHMARVLLAIEEYNRRLQAGPRDPRCGTPSVCVGLISGGTGVNTVPERCTIELDRRLIPGETVELARVDLRCFLEEKTGLRDAIEHEPPWMEGPPLPDQSQAEMAVRLSTWARRVAGQGQMVAAHFATDAPFFAAVDIPTVVFGPGSIAQAHTADEWIAVDQVEWAVEILFHWILSWPTNLPQ
ncbi:MAG: M20 family metallopeptidase [Thermoguttaceae bacterium]|nr:M20 family metallopeptidase [Thermoguttaceae bacterium]MDW8077821.1 M20 family metallopeptidase [Thermoguttaceae bacterium]